MRVFLVAAAIIAAALSSAYAQPCEPGDGRSAALLSREVAGNRDFNEVLEGPEWTFELKRAPYGWDIRLLDENGLDLTQIRVAADVVGSA